MKRDIQICYDTLGDIMESLNDTKTALETVYSVLETVDKNVKLNKGKSINEFNNVNEKLRKETQELTEEVNDLYKIFDAYIESTQSYIKPVNPYQMMRVDRNDIWWNLFSISSIKSSCKPLSGLKECSYSTWDYYVSDDDEDREAKLQEYRKWEHNFFVMEQYRLFYRTICEKIEDELEQMYSLYKNKIVEFENADDEMAKTAKGLYDKYSNFFEKFWDAICAYLKIRRDILAGVFQAAIDFVLGVLTLAWNIVVLDFSCRVAIICTPFGKVPNWAKANMIEASQVILLLKDPILLAESITQGASDVITEKGVAYGVGYVVGDVLVDLLVTKGVGKVAGSADDVASAANKAEDFIDEGVTFIKYTDDVEEIAKYISKLDLDTLKDICSKLDDVDLAKVVGDLDQSKIDDLLKACDPDLAAKIKKVYKGGLNSLHNLDDLLSNPQKLTGTSGEELYNYLLKNGYEVKPLGKGSFKGIPFEEGGGFKVNWGGDRILQYHPESLSHHGGAYFKISSGETGTVRIDLDGNLIK